MPIKTKKFIAIKGQENAVRRAEHIKFWSLCGKFLGGLGLRQRYFTTSCDYE
jgi:hypothetical protein